MKKFVAILFCVSLLGAPLLGQSAQNSSKPCCAKKQVAQKSCCAKKQAAKAQKPSCCAKKQTAKANCTGCYTGKTWMTPKPDCKKKGCQTASR